MASKRRGHQLPQGGFGLGKRVEASLFEGATSRHQHAPGGLVLIAVAALADLAPQHFGDGFLFACVAALVGGIPVE